MKCVKVPRDPYQIEVELETKISKPGPSGPWNPDPECKPQDFPAEGGKKTVKLPPEPYKPPSCPEKAYCCRKVLVNFAKEWFENKKRCVGRVRIPLLGTYRIKELGFWEWHTEKPVFGATEADECLCFE